MEYEQLTLEGFAKRTEAVEHSLAEITERLDAIEARLGKREKKTRKATQYRQLQTAQIEQLAEIIQSLAKDAPLRGGANGTAINKEEAYRRFEECGIGKVTAMRALRKAGALRLDRAGRNTSTIWLDGKCQRVIIVITKE